MDDFRDFCLDQIDRLGVLDPNFRFQPPAVPRSYTDWLVAKSADDEKKARDFMTAVIDHFDELPSLPSLRKFWDSLYPRPRAREASLDCAYCRGEGYETFDKPNGTSYADRCRCGGYPRSQPLTHEELMAPKDEELAALLAEAVEAKSL